jgi:hypothetical protein
MASFNRGIKFVNEFVVLSCCWSAMSVPLTETKDFVDLQDLFNIFAPVPMPTADDKLLAEIVANLGEGIDSPNNRRPVMFIPSFAGVRLRMQLQNRELRSPLDIFCRRNTDTWLPAWLPEKSDVNVLNAHCLVDNMAFGVPSSNDAAASSSYPPPRAGVLVEPEDSFDACMALDVGGVYQTFGTWAKALAAGGWAAGADMDALPYDWRVGPDALAAPGGAFDRLRAAIEGLVARAGGRRAVAVSMSMGGPVFALFCATHVSEAWKVRAPPTPQISSSSPPSPSPLPPPPSHHPPPPHHHHHHHPPPGARSPYPPPHPPHPPSSSRM